MQNKIDVENKKLEQIIVQNKNQEKLAQQKAKLDKEMLNKKMQLEKQKIKIKPKINKK